MSFFYIFAFQNNLIPHFSVWKNFYTESSLYPFFLFALTMKIDAYMVERLGENMIILTPTVDVTFKFDNLPPEFKRVFSKSMSYRNQRNINLLNYFIYVINFNIRHMNLEIDKIYMICLYRSDNIF